MVVAGERLFSIIGDSEKEKVSISAFDKIAFNNVSFNYGSGNVLENVNFEINSGDKILIKGNSGEGKTTLIKLLAGLYTPSEGIVSITSNGVDFAPSEIKNLISFVPQGNMIFNGSIKENVVFNSKYDQDRFNYSINLAGLSDVVKKYGENYSLSGDTNLSEGQEQRLAIARAIYKNSPIIIMDEPTSSLDVDTELEFAKSLSSLKGVTLIIISHKPAISKFVDKVICVEGGKVI